MSQPLPVFTGAQAILLWRREVSVQAEFMIRLSDEQLATILRDVRDAFSDAIEVWRVTDISPNAIRIGTESSTVKEVYAWATDYFHYVA